jgi:hypothetical protein
MCDVLGLEWVLTSEPVAAAGLIDRTPEGLHGPERLYQRATCAPRATLPARVRVVPDRGERLRLLADRSRDAVGEVLLEEPLPWPVDATAQAQGTVRVLHWDDEAIALEVDAASAGVVRIADPYDDGWTATVDGAPARILVADHFLRAVAVPAGTHRVDLAYDAPRVRWPPRLGLIGVGLAALAVALGFIARPRSEDAP